MGTILLSTCTGCIYVIICLDYRRLLTADEILANEIFSLVFHVAVYKQKYQIIKLIM